MSKKESGPDKESKIPLLPFGETLRPLLRAGSLSDNDLKFMLQRRGVFVKDAHKSKTIPKLTSFLLSPREFELLRDRQQFKENTIKTSDAKTTWSSEKTVVQAMPDECQPFVEELIDESSSYQLTKCKLQNVHSDEVVINLAIERQDWTKDTFSNTTYHDCRLSISREASSNIVTFHSETTVPETKELVDKVQKAIHSHFIQEGVVLQGTPIQKILAEYFVSNQAIFEFLRIFINQVDTPLSFRKVVDIDAGINSNSRDFPENFSWLKEGNIDKVNLHGSKIHQTDVMKLGKIGILEFGEIEAEFQFEYQGIKGVCIIKYGFPEYYAKTTSEFEVKVASLQLYSAYQKIPRDQIRRFLLQQFQKDKHKVFEQFKTENKINTQKQSEGQYAFEGEGWDLP